jgi:hypothetical protein
VACTSSVETGKTAMLVDDEARDVVVSDGVSIADEVP